MLSRASSILALALYASASVLPRTGQCNTGSLECCNSVQSASTPSITSLLGSLGIVPESVTGLVGVNCVSVIGVKNSCNQQPVCCTNNNFNGLVALGCNPFNTNL